MSTKYKLKYYDIPGRGEPIRLIFTLAKVPFEDVRIKMDDWPTWKPTMPWGQIPVLEVGDKTIAQSGTIARFLARRFKLIGANEFEEAKCEELVDASVDMIIDFKKFRLEKDEAKKAEIKKHLIENIVPKYYSKFDAVQAQNGGSFLVGKSVTWTDAWIYYVLEKVEETLGEPGLVKSYPNLAKFQNSFSAIPQIKEYVEKRDAQNK